MFVLDDLTGSPLGCSPVSLLVFCRPGIEMLPAEARLSGGGGE